MTLQDMNLLNKKSKERKNEKPLERKAIKGYLIQLENKWELIDNKKIAFTFKFKTFKDSISFVNKVADLAESENHHPNFHIHYNKVRLSLSTHSVGGLSENDFIVAAKIEDLVSHAGAKR
jgi:4a-hydroxytetrahydrobiopterin dehydratase